MSVKAQYVDKLSDILFLNIEQRYEDHKLPSVVTRDLENMGHDVGFDHGLPCRVKNMARGTQ